MDTPWIRLGYVFSRIPKIWIHIGSDKCIRHVFERVSRGGERMEAPHPGQIRPSSVPPSPAPVPATVSSSGGGEHGVRKLQGRRRRRPRAPGGLAGLMGSEERRRPRVRALPPRSASRGGEGLVDEVWVERGKRRRAVRFLLQHS